MPVHDMTKAAASIVGQPATGTVDRCGTCGYGTAGELAILVHAASCPHATGEAAVYVACDWSKCRRVLDPVRVARGAKTCSERHRGRAWKERTRYGRHDAQGRGGRANGSQRPAKPSGLQVAYGRAYEELHARLWHFPDGEALIKEALRAALSERQRAQLEARERSNT
jgi:hypothetical protein